MPPVHAFFDFDDTLIQGDSILYWMRFYYARRPARRIFQIVNWLGLMLYAARMVDSHTLKRFFLVAMAYEDPDVLDRLGAEFVRADLAYRFRAPVLERLWSHHRLGHKVVVISASATFYLRHLKALLPMAEILGTEVIFPRGTWRFPRYRDGNLRGENKIARLATLGFGTQAPLSFAYSDHQHDVFLLRFAEFPVCVWPTAKLRRLARENGWPVMEGARAHPAWMEKLGKAWLLLFAAAPDPDTHSASAPADPERHEAAAREYAPLHVRALRERVAMKYSEPENGGIYRRIFGEAASVPAPRRVGLHPGADHGKIEG